MDLRKGVVIRMKQLNYQTLQDLNCQQFILKEAPEKILQFGEGNFLRAFADYFINEMNEKADFNAKVVLCQPLSVGMADMINEQDGLYTVYQRGCVQNKQVCEHKIVSCVSRCLNPYSQYDGVMELANSDDLQFIICNTTEAGIVFDGSCQFAQQPPESYPAKLTQFLYKRFENKKPGFIILSCELIDNNGKELERCVLEYAKLWTLGEDFESWVHGENCFCSTLVDKIVTGYPRAEAPDLWQELGYQDNLMVTAETFAFWVIEGPQSIKEVFPFEKAGLPIVMTDDHAPYKQRKVRILNGAHTSLVMGAYLAGKNIVRDCMEDAVMCKFMNQTIYDEIIPTLTLPQEELEEFAASVTDRFNNPFIDHALLNISLNSTAKWRARVLPSLKRYVENTGELPACIVASLAFYIKFYQGFALSKGALVAKREQEEYLVRDDGFVLDFFFAHREDTSDDLAQYVCSNEAFFGEDLSKINGLLSRVQGCLSIIETKGTYALMEACISQ